MLALAPKISDTPIVFFDRRRTKGCLNQLCLSQTLKTSPKRGLINLESIDESPTVDFKFGEGNKRGFE